jgi:hypothetical protein
MKSGTIKEIKPNGTWKELFKFEYEMEFKDDTGKVMTETGGALHKTKDSPYHVGQIIDYEITQNDKGFWNIKFQNDKPVFSGKSNYVPKDPVEEAKKQAMIVRQSSVKVAADLVGYGKIDYDNLLIVAQRITDWAIGDAKAEKMTEPSNEMPY